MTHADPPFQRPEVAAKFGEIPLPKQCHLLGIRNRIFMVAQSDERIGPIEEALKWGQPAYLTTKTRSGTTLRLGVGKQGNAAVFAHCQTSVMSDFQALTGADFQFDGNRGLWLSGAKGANDPRLDQLIYSALTYHL